MYPHYFGLREPSFSLTPDPHYLFLSEQHREALAHLLYGASENGGFVLLTGEVGTGKTTVCRAFLEQLPPGVEVALVLNPALTAIELMHAICDEFRLSVPPGETSAKALLDRLNDYLLAAHADGRHPVVIIDEAQNLRPKVLEQVRLLTNLETNKAKLLQIFLIGQPELRAMLGSPELRQLNQRITARFHLRPLDARATAAYIEHRISVAGVDRPLFTPGALRAVHRQAGGVPRLINLICDRALLGAAVSRRLQVTPDIVHRAAREVKGQDRPPARAGALLRPMALAVSLLLAAGLGAGLGAWLGASGRLAPLVASAPPAAPAEAAAEPAPATGPVLASAAVPLPEAALASTSGIDAPTAPGEAHARPPVAAPADPPPADLASRDPTPGDAPSPVGADQAGPGPVSAAMTADLPPEPSAQADSPTALAAVAAAPTPAPPATAPAAPPEPATANAPRISLARVAARVQQADAAALPGLTLSAVEAVPALLRLWRQDGAQTAPATLGCAGLPSYGLACERSSGRWHDLRRFDRPAALRLQLDGRSRYVVLTGLDEEFAVLTHRDQAYRLPVATLDEHWSGDFLLLWRPPVSGVRNIGGGATGPAVQWLRQQLAALPTTGIGATGPDRYDAALSAAVRRFQAEQGLVADGIAGPQTLILLDNALATAEVPRLSQSR